MLSKDVSDEVNELLEAVRFPSKPRLPARRLQEQLMGSQKDAGFCVFVKTSFPTIQPCAVSRILEVWALLFYAGPLVVFVVEFVVLFVAAVSCQTDPAHRGDMKVRHIPTLARLVIAQFHVACSKVACFVEEEHMDCSDVGRVGMETRYLGSVELLARPLSAII